MKLNKWGMILISEERDIASPKGYHIKKEQKSIFRDILRTGGALEHA